MNTWGRGSIEQRSTSDSRLNETGDKVLEIKNHSVIKGHRPEAEQRHAFAKGHSKLDWPNGNHNSLPSTAEDVRTYPNPPASELAIEFESAGGQCDPELFAKVLTALRAQPLREDQLYLLGMYKAVGHMLGHDIRTGADWDRDGEVADNGFDDFFHIEIDG